MDCKGCQSYSKGGEVCKSHGASASQKAMQKRRMAKGGAVEDDFETMDDFDFEPDPKSVAAEEDDKSLIGQVMKKRRASRG